MDNSIFEPFIRKWDLAADGTQIVTHTSSLLPVSFNGRAAMLKVATDPKEKLGANLMMWWNGEGAAKVFEHFGDAILMERATGNRSLFEMAEHGQDDEASAIICTATARLHQTRKQQSPKLLPLAHWFNAILERPREGIFADCARAAELLLREPRDVCSLHGDIHHANILDFGNRGWLAIDPKGVIGERTFDYANIFCNPNHHIATTAGRLERQLQVIASSADLEETRLLHWILAWAGLSATWLIEDKLQEHVEPTLQVARIAAAVIDNRSAKISS